jgi:hypothetical protein
MKQKLSILSEALSILIGTWLFILNTLDTGSDERILAGLGAALLFSSLLVKEIRLKQSIAHLKMIWKVAVIALGTLGTGLFITNTLGTGSDERILAGLGGGLVLISLYIKDFRISQDTEKNTLNLKTGLVFLVIFTLYGLQKKDIRHVEKVLDSIEWEVSDEDDRVNDIESKVNDIESKVKGVESNLSYLEYKVGDLEDESHYHY